MRPRTALLARPHPVIVDAMRDVVVASGLEPHALSSREQLVQWPSAEVALIVVSTSVHSTVQASFEDIIRIAQHVHPTAALVIGTVVETEHARSLLTDMLAHYRVEGRLCTSAELASSDAHDVGRNILLVSRRELERSEGRFAVVSAIRRLVDSLAAPDDWSRHALPEKTSPGNALSAFVL